MPSTVEPTSRDVVFGATASADSSTEHVMNDFLADAIRLYRVMHALNNDNKEEVEVKKDDEQVKELVDKLIKIVTKGKDYHLAGIRNVPTPFLTSTGRFLDSKAAASSSSSSNKEGEGEEKEAPTVTYTYKELSETQVKKKLVAMVVEEFGKPLEGVDEKESPYKDFKAILERYPAVADPDKKEDSTSDPIVPTAKDAILIDASDTRSSADRIQEHELGNKVIFNMSSQLVTTYTTTSAKRVEAALSIMHNLDDTQVVVSNPLTPEGAEAEASVPPPTQKARFLIRKVNDEDRSTWSLLDSVSASIIMLCFVFEVYLEKGINASADTGASTPETTAGSTGAIESPNEFDVLFGRGGLTNAHLGNKRL